MNKTIRPIVASTNEEIANALAEVHEAQRKLRDAKCQLEEANHALVEVLLNTYDIAKYVLKPDLARVQRAINN